MREPDARAVGVSDADVDMKHPHICDRCGLVWKCGDLCNGIAWKRCARCWEQARKMLNGELP